MDNNLGVIDTLSKSFSKFFSLKHGEVSLYILFGPLGDFDSFEYARALVSALPRLKSLGVNLFAIGIGNNHTKDRFCSFTGFPPNSLEVVSNTELHESLGLNKGLKTSLGSTLDLMMMCLGVASPGTLSEVVRGYLGDTNSASIFNSGEPNRDVGRLPKNLRLFDLIGGQGSLRPLELATLRLINMIEILSNYTTYIPFNEYLTQRGATFMVKGSDQILYSFKAKSILLFCEDMANPLSFLDSLCKD